MKIVPTKKLIVDSVKFGFNQTFKHFGGWIIAWLTLLGFALLGCALISLIIFIINILFIHHPMDSFSLETLTKAGVSIMLAVTIPGIIFLLVYLPSLTLGIVRMCLNFFDTQEIKFRPLLKLRKIFSYIISQLIIAFWISLFFIIFYGILGIYPLKMMPLMTASPLGKTVFFMSIISAIVLNYIFSFYIYYIVDKNFGAFASVGASWRLSWNNWKAIGALSIITSLIFLIPLLGLIITQLISVYVYRTLTSEEVK